MTMPLYLDEDAMRRSLVRALRDRGIDVLTALDAGMIEREDREHLDYATKQRRVVCTFNRGDFYRLHSEYVAQGKRHAGIVLMRQQHLSVGEQMRRMLKLIANKSAEEMENWIEFLSAWDG
jgi:predicted nuclease of predicted toxin-antitoxin system